MMAYEMKTAPNSPKDVPESEILECDYPLHDGELPIEISQRIFAKSMARWRNFQQFWQPSLDSGKKYFDMCTGEGILTGGEKEEYRRQDKMPIIVPELIPKINALEGMQIGARRTGTVIAVEGQDAPDTALIDHILREDIQRKNNLSEEKTQAFTDGIISSFPQAIWFDLAPENAQNKRLDVFHGQWNDTLADPKFTRRDYSDGEEVIRIRTMTRQQLLGAFPLRHDEINKKFPPGTSWDNLSMSSTMAGETSQTRDTVIERMNGQMTMYAASGLMYIIERMFFIRRRAAVYVSPYAPEQPEILPPDWTPAEINKWKEFHPDYSAMERDVKILWVTTVTPFGMVLENRPHWFQEEEFPCEFYIPRMLNNKIHGIIEFLTGSLKGRNVMRIEQLHSLRMSNDQLMLVKKGALANPATAATEKARTGGIIVLNPLASMEDIKFPLNQRENMGWQAMSEQFLSDIDRLSVDRNFEGSTQSSQESGKVVKQRIAQTQLKHLPYLTSFALFNLRVDRKAVMMIPYRWTEREMIRYVDRASQEPKEVVINDPQDYSWVTGAAASVKNNLAGARYDYVEEESDNSPTAKEHEQLEFNEILDHLGQIQNVSLWPSLLSSVQNKMAQDFGKKLSAQLQSQALAAANSTPKPENIRLSLNLDGKDIESNPAVWDILKENGFVKEPSAPQGGTPAPVASPAIAAPAGAPA